MGSSPSSFEDVSASNEVSVSAGMLSAVPVMTATASFTVALTVCATAGAACSTCLSISLIVCGRAKATSAKAASGSR